MDAITFSLTFETSDEAKKFVKKVTGIYGVPCLRYEALVYVIAQHAAEQRDILNLGRMLGSTMESTF